MRAAYQEAADTVLLTIRAGFPEAESGVEDDEIDIKFTITGAWVGMWRDGRMRLMGDPI